MGDRLKREREGRWRKGSAPYAKEHLPATPERGEITGNTPGTWAVGEGEL